jgi:uncharacterized protein (TIGR03435 family)
MPYRSLSGVLLLAASSLTLVAQVQPAFEVTSVRANTSGERRASMGFTPGGDFNASNQPVRVLLNFAYSIPLFRVEGMPDWFTSVWSTTGRCPAIAPRSPRQCTSSWA